VFRWDAFVTRQVCIPNLQRIQQAGLATWFHEQLERKAILEDLLARYNEGRSRSYYCLAAALLPVDVLRSAVKEARKKLAQLKLGGADLKTKARMFRLVIQDFATKSKTALTLRRKPK
jgi:hypothetical protein